MKEVIGDATNQDIISAIGIIKTARETDNSAQGLISRSTDFREAKAENFLFDSGASVSIMGEMMARENKLTIRRPFFSPRTWGHCPQEIIRNHRKYL